MSEIIYYKACRVRCRKCGDILEYINKTKQDNSVRAIMCSCQKVGLDASAFLYRILGNESDFDDLSEIWPLEQEPGL